MNDYKRLKVQIGKSKLNLRLKTCTVSRGHSIGPHHPSKNEVLLE